VWNRAPCCTACNHTFSVVQRRHHCRCPSFHRTRVTLFSLLSVFFRFCMSQDLAEDFFLCEASFANVAVRSLLPLLHRLSLLFRICGHVFCNSCTSDRVLLVPGEAACRPGKAAKQNSAPKKERACKSCFKARAVAPFSHSLFRQPSPARTSSTPVVNHASTNLLGVSPASSSHSPEPQAVEPYDAMPPAKHPPSVG
jgi:hypothetical protein